MSDAERREKARLRSERWRRAHGIMPRRPAQKPWLAEGCSRSTWYRRRNRARERAAVAAAGAFAPLSSSAPSCSSNPGGSFAPFNTRADICARAAAFVRELQAELAEVARCQAVTAAIIGELSGHL
jgi:hypothetical protein